MEKIKQAIEKARLQQRGNTDAEKEHRNESSQAGSDAPESSEPRINYSKTRVVPLNKGALSRNRIVLGEENDEASTAYNILRTQVDQRLAAKQWNSLAITSASANQGKTLTAINLSIALAREIHRTVLLVDADLRNPSIHERFEISPTYGLVDYLLDDVPVSDILVNPGIERLVLLPAGRAVTNSSELVSSPKMVRLTEELKSRYPSRIVVFDLPPLLSADDTLAFSPYVDTTLLVVEDGESTREELVRAVEMLEGVHLLGTVLNKSTETQSVYGRYT